MRKLTARLSAAAIIAAGAVVALQAGASAAPFPSHSNDWAFSAVSRRPARPTRSCPSPPPYTYPRSASAPAPRRPETAT